MCAGVCLHASVCVCVCFCVFALVLCVCVKVCASAGMYRCRCRPMHAWTGMCGCRIVCVGEDLCLCVRERVCVGVFIKGISLAIQAYLCYCGHKS